MNAERCDESRLVEAARAVDGRTIVAFTVDLEPDCPPYLNGFRGMEEGLPRLLEVLASVRDDGQRIPATFFTTGEVAQRYPRVIEQLVSAGHELACHGMTHRSFATLGPDEAREEIERSAKILRAFAPVTSFRAPYLQLPTEYVELLKQNEFTLDSSQARYKLSYYRDRRPWSIQRVPASVTSSVLRLPKVLRSGYLQVLSSPIVLFVHPWEFVDLTREKLRIDCRFRTGAPAAECVRDVLAGYWRGGASFVRATELRNPEPAIAL